MAFYFLLNTVNGKDKNDKVINIKIVIGILFMFCLRNGMSINDYLHIVCTNDYNTFALMLI